MILDIIDLSGMCPPNHKLGIAISFNMNEDCPFCRIVNGSLSARVVAEDEHALAFLPKKLAVHGHTLIIPKDHFVPLFDIDADSLASVLSLSKSLAEHYAQTINSQGVNILHASGTAAQQSVPHFHIHLIPRFEQDGVNAWPRFPSYTGDVDQLHQLCRLG